MTASEAQVMSRVAAILSTLLETGGGPESSIYLALGANLSMWEGLKGLMLRSDLIAISGHWVELTEKGRQMAEKCNAVLAGAKR